MDIKNITTKTRVAQLKAMHELMLNVNDEEIYMTWIMGWIPDEPIEDDFIDCAKNDDNYNETFDLFIRLIQKARCRW